MAVADYRQQLIALSPPGQAWNIQRGSDYTGLLEVFAIALSRVGDHIQTSLDELDPRTATYLLPEWERCLDLPDRCAPANQTLQQRREAAHAKYVMRGGQSKAYFIKLAERLGYIITIDIYRPFIAGLSRCGEALQPEDCRFNWRVNIPGNRAVYFRTGESAAGESLLHIVSASELECVFRRLQPSHTDLFFNYQ
ncbi:YmfQ family protein [Aliamphritea ceti]|uniref:YmfQ family protein n=1 Tax=Aliamphritea ceti TaxID=1524258 RepID=UPI0021C40254|nr:putative phage tail protein [Aliamphritea ceti]